MTITTHGLLSTDAASPFMGVAVDKSGVGFVERMPTLTGQLAGIVASYRIATENIVPWSGKPHVVNVDTERPVAQVVNLHAFWDRAMHQFPGEAMGVDKPSVSVTTVAQEELPISTIAMHCNFGSPQPTWSPVPNGAILVHLWPESFDWQHGDWASSHGITSYV